VIPNLHFDRLGRVSPVKHYGEIPNGVESVSVDAGLGRPAFALDVGVWVDLAEPLVVLEASDAHHSQPGYHRWSVETAALEPWDWGNVMLQLFYVGGMLGEYPEQKLCRFIRFKSCGYNDEATTSLWHFCTEKNMLGLDVV